MVLYTMGMQSGLGMRVRSGSAKESGTIVKRHRGRSAKAQGSGPRHRKLGNV